MYGIRAIVSGHYPGICRWNLNGVLLQQVQRCLCLSPFEVSSKNYGYASHDVSHEISGIWYKQAVYFIICMDNMSTNASHELRIVMIFVL